MGLLNLFHHKNKYIPKHAKKEQLNAVAAVHLEKPLNNNSNIQNQISNIRKMNISNDLKWKKYNDFARKISFTTSDNAIILYKEMADQCKREGKFESAVMYYSFLLWLEVTGGSYQPDANKFKYFDASLMEDSGLKHWSNQIRICCKKGKLSNDIVRNIIVSSKYKALPSNTFFYLNDNEVLNYVSLVFDDFKTGNNSATEFYKTIDLKKTEIKISKANLLLFQWQ